MATQFATPLHIVESYFDVDLDRSALTRFNRIDEAEWIDFCKHYRAAMDRDFASQFLEVPEEGVEAPLRLFFDPRLAHTWDSAVRKTYEPTPLLGLSPDPGHASEITRDTVSRMLGPLKKHMLVADSIYVRDSFYYCFDAVADSVSRTRWREDPNVEALVEESIRKLRAWLPVLVELRDLIESRALVFMPYYMTPSFPYAGDAPALKGAMRRVRMRPRPDVKPPAPPTIDFDHFFESPEHDTQDGVGGSDPTSHREYVDENAVLGAWLNARLLDLDPVFPNRAMFDWAADLYLDEDAGVAGIASDLISMDILPFGAAKAISLDELLKLRKNEKVFDDVRQAVLACKGFLEDKVGSSATPEGATAACKQFLRDRLDEYERKSTLRFIDDHPVAGMAFSAAFGAALLPVPPLVGLLATTALAPNLALRAQRRFDPKRRAISNLQALL